MTDRALILDFDGTILDTEWPLYAAYLRLHDEHGLDPIPIEVWQQTIGLADDAMHIDFTAELVSARPHLSYDEVNITRRAHRDELLAEEDVRPGIVAWIEHAEALGVPIGVASSSSPDWLFMHLERVDLAGRIHHVEGTSPGQNGKPAPDVYLRVLEALGADPSRSIAVEDTPTGVSAAVAAGLTCIAVPNRITESSDLSGAHHRAESLAHVDPAHWLV